MTFNGHGHGHRHEEGLGHWHVHEHGLVDQGMRSQTPRRHANVVGYTEIGYIQNSIIKMKQRFYWTTLNNSQNRSLDHPDLSRHFRRMRTYDRTENSTLHPIIVVTVQKTEGGLHTPQLTLIVN